MNHSSRHRNNINRARAWVRSLCLLCAALLCLGLCTGCSTEKLEALNSALSDANREIEALKDADAAAQQEIDALKESRDAAQQEIDALKESRDAAQKEIDALKESRDAAQKEIDALKESHDAAQKEIDALKESHDAAQQEIDTAHKEIDTLKDSYEAAQQEIASLTEQVEQLLESIVPNEPTEKIRIYLDQGHNPTSYHNAGATGNGLYEQDVTFTVGYLLGQLLEEDGRFEVRLSRPTINTVLGTDNASSLEARVQGAQEFGADYFISLHTNAFDSESVHGIEVLVAEQGGASHTLGSHLLSGMIVSTGLHNRGVKLRSELHVLRNATMPAVLLEMGFITNAGDAAVMSQRPDLFAQGIYQGILAYLDLPPA